MHTRIEIQSSKAIRQFKSWNYFCQMFKAGSDLVLFKPHFHHPSCSDQLNVMRNNKITGSLLFSEFRKASKDLKTAS